MNNVSWALFDKYGLDIQEKLRRMGTAIDFVHTTEDVECWQKHPEYFPLEYRNKLVCLWSTLEMCNGDRHLNLVARNGRRIEVYRLAA